MGWCNGTILFDNIMDMIFKKYDEKTLKQKIQEIIAEFEMMDWDCQEESKYIQENPLVREAYKELHKNDEW